MDKIIVLDFGSQYSHLICRRLREFNIFCELVPFDINVDKIRELNPKGIIFSGGPASVYSKDSPKPDNKIFELGIPILGICYGHQLIVDHFKGKIKRVENREYGNALLNITSKQNLFKNIQADSLKCWMSHSDAAEVLPEGFEVLGKTSSSFSAAIGNKNNNIFGLQFHPEVAHTEQGNKVLFNFANVISRAKQEWNITDLTQDIITNIKDLVHNEKVLCAVSGGIDSTTCAILIHRAIKSNLTCVFVDNGLLRANERESVIKMFEEELKIPLNVIDASDKFLNALEKITDPEIKRKKVGEVFARVFTEFAESNGPFQWLAQGTLYPDVIESGVSGGPATIIKTHHNVGGLPDWLNLKVLEPLRLLYKDEVRNIAKILNVPDHILKRHPFPGPGLAVRILGEITAEKITIVRKASAIVEEILLEENLYDKVWQAFAIVGDDKAVGILGDERIVGHVVYLRVVESVDAMTADWVRLPYHVLEKISSRITNEINDVTWVTYTISSKPPATIEPL
jgi:GMP synthase (glutamine-hydrolysing)